MLICGLINLIWYELWNSLNCWTASWDFVRAQGSFWRPRALSLAGFIFHPSRQRTVLCKANPRIICRLIAKLIRDRHVSDPGRLLWGGWHSTKPLISWNGNHWLADWLAGWFNDQINWETRILSGISTQRLWGESPGVSIRVICHFHPSRCEYSQRL